MLRELTDAEMDQQHAFRECSACRSKAGTPLLCESCLHNRTAIESLQSKLEAARTAGRDALQRVLNTLDQITMLVELKRSPGVREELFRVGKWIDLYLHGGCKP